MVKRCVSKGRDSLFHPGKTWVKLELGRTGMEKFIVDGGEVRAQKKMLAFYFRFTRQEKMIVRLL